MNSLNPRLFTWVLGVAVLVGLITAGGIALQKVKFLSLPISPWLPAFTAALPVLAAVSIPLAKQLKARGESQKSPWLTLSVTIFFVIYETVIATLSLTHMVGSNELLCSLNKRWGQLYSEKNADAIKKIQDTYQCCGLHAVKDMAWPFPEGSHPKYDACAVTFNRNKSCYAEWRGDEQLAAGLLLLVAIVIFLTKFAVLFLLHTNNNWVKKFLSRRPLPINRQIQYSPINIVDAEAHSDDDDRRRIGYRDDPEIGPEAGPEAGAVSSLHTAGEGNGGDASRKPVVEVNGAGNLMRVVPSGLATGGSEWAT